ncbi:MAG: phage major capsid protein [Micromonosporaceae bacterium]|nr:phage major capsid protein [Micromonosporaceae bacterium]
MIELQRAVARAFAGNGPSEELDALNAELDEALAAADALKDELERREAVQRARERHQKDALGDDRLVEVPLASGSRAALPAGMLRVTEADMYDGPHGRSFIHDLFAAQVKGDVQALERITRHQAYEAERYAVSSGTLGGIIPPQYLIDLYAKAPRNGRVFCDQVNRQPLPDVGMSLIVPRLTQGTTAAVQASENTTVATQDPVETDLTVPVRTIAGYLPVSRQTLERAAYSDQILFEDLIARYFATLDAQALNGSGASGEMLGVLNTAGVSSSTASTGTVAAVWPKVADVIQQINTALAGVGYVADKIFMHPRRWGFFEAALDTANRPLFGLDGAGNYAPFAQGQAAGVGQVGRMHGLPVFIDPNIPTNLGAGTNEDRIIVTASQVVHLWERTADPVTLAFEQSAANQLQVQLVVYGYAAFTAGRYPAAVGVVSGAGLAPPTF